MADEKKTYLINIESNLKKYADDAVEAKKRADELKSSLESLKKAGATPAEIEAVNAAYKNANAEYTKAQKLAQIAAAAISSETGSRKQLGEILKLQQYELGKLGNAMIKDAQGILRMNPLYIEQAKRVKETSDVIQKYDKTLGDGRSSIGLYSEAIESAMGKFSALPGPIGRAASAVQGFGTQLKALLLNPIMLLIAGITLAFAGLYKVFVSTAEGAGVVKDAWAGLRAQANVLRDRVISLIDSVHQLFTGDMEAAAISYAKAIDLGGESMKKATNAAIELSKQQRELNKQLAFHISEEANENLEIQKYLFLSKDKALMDQERIDMLQKSLDLMKEQGIKAADFAKEQFRIDSENAVLKAKQSGVSAEVLRNWIALNQEEQQAALEGSKQLQDLYNRLGGAAAIAALETSYAKITEANTKLFEQGKRANSQMSTLVQSIADDNLKYWEDRWKIAEDLNASRAKKAEERIAKAKKEREEAEKEMAKAKSVLTKELEDYRKYLDEKRLLEVEADAKRKQDRLDYQEWLNERELINQDNLLQIRQSNNEYTFSIQREQLRLQQQEEIANAIKTGADINIIKGKYSAAQREIDKAEAYAKLELYSDFAGNLAIIFGQSTALGKAAAIAQTTISTYAAAQKAYESVIEVPVIGPVLAVVAAAAAVAAGIANVKKILAVKSGLPGDSGGSASMPTAITSMPVAQRVFANQVESSVLTQPQLTQSQLNTFPQQNLLTAEDIANALRNMPAPIVTVEDINAKAASKRKVEVRANI
jgi:hypothetical protein